MLTHVTIKDFIIVEALSLEFHGGLTVLTGETGAGKSLLLDALEFVLGGRADAGMIRGGGERADIAATFLLDAVPEACAWLRAHELDDSGECLLRRTLAPDARSRGFINGQAMPVQALRELGELLVDIHSQNVHQALVKSAVQRRTLDEYAGHADLLAQLAAQFAHWQSLRNEYERLSAARQERDAKLELLRYQVAELHALGVGPNEMEELNQEHARLANAHRLLEACERALQLLSENDELAVTSAVDRIGAELEPLKQYDAALNPAAELITSAGIQLHEAARSLRAYRAALEADPERLQEIENRIGILLDLARKHRVTPEELPALQTRLQHALEELENADVRVEQLRVQLDQAQGAYRDSASALRVSRKKAARKLSSAITRHMQELGMGGGVFEIGVAELEPEQFTASGLDQVEFLVSANPGQAPRPLNKVASGGELSRISLAIAVTTAQIQGVPTLIFDEVDTGVGGGVAEIVGRQLRALSAHRQVFCVTHLAQVAAQGRHHVAVQKETRGAITRTSVDTLSREQRIQEIGRMLGGVKITPQTLAHAKEMLEQAQVS